MEIYFLCFVSCDDKEWVLWRCPCGEFGRKFWCVMFVLNWCDSEFRLGVREGRRACGGGVWCMMLWDGGGGGDGGDGGDGGWADITTVMWTGNLIGIVFARTLHYQFYTW